MQTSEALEFFEISHSSYQPFNFLPLLSEKVPEHDSEIFACFVDFEKAFDGIQ